MISSRTQVLTNKYTMEQDLKDPLLEREKLDHTISVRVTESQFKELTHLSASFQTARNRLIQDAIANYLKRFRPLKSATSAKK